MTKKKNGGTKAENVVKGKGKGKATGYGKKFKGDFADATPIRVLKGHVKLKAIGTYGKLKAYIVKSLDRGISLSEIGEGLEVSGSRISEFVNILGIERPKKGTGEICVDRPTIGPDGEFKMEAPREKKSKPKTKKLPNGDVLTRI